MVKYNIAILVDAFYDEYENRIWQDMVRGARSKKINLITILGGAINSPNKNNFRRNMAYQLVIPENIHGIIAFTAAIGSNAPKDKIIHFLNQFHPLPVVNIGMKVEGHHCILVNNREGMKALLTHLINDHGYKRIAFIKGPPDNQEAQLRFQVYKEVLAANHLTFNEDLLIQGNFCKNNSRKDMELFLDKKSGAFDAIVGANDFMAIDAMEALQNRNIQVPGQVGVAGFDDVQESASLLRPLTTVKQPAYEIAREALELILKLVKKDSLPQIIELPTRLIIRRSCGCFLEDGEESGKAEQHHILTPLVTSMAEHLSPDTLPATISLWAEKLIKHIKTDLDKKDTRTFLLTLEEILIESVKTHSDILEWYPVITSFFESLKPQYDKVPLFHDLWRCSFKLIGKSAEHYQAKQWMQSRNKHYNLHLFAEALRDMFSRKKEHHSFASHMASLNIHSLYLGMYPSPEDMNDLYMIIQYEKGNIQEIDFTTRLATHTLLKNTLAANENREMFTVIPVYSDTAPLGIAIIVSEFLDGTIYETLGSYLNVALYEAKLFREVRTHNEKLEAEVKSRTKELQSVNQELSIKNKKIMELNRELDIKSKIDGLTGIYNRRALYDLLDKEISNTNRNYSRFHKSGLRKKIIPHNDPALQLCYLSLILVDVDHFKQINDEHGHKVGDQVLVELSRILDSRRICRREDIVGRFGGEEFILILPGTSSENAMHVARRLMNEVSHTIITVERKRLDFTISVGVAQFSPPEDNRDDVISRAEKALSKAKEGGRNRIIHYEEFNE